MRPKKLSLFGVAPLVLSALVACLLLAPGGAALAQQITGTPGSPSATMTIPGNQLPAQPPELVASSTKALPNPSPIGRPA